MAHANTISIRSDKTCYGPKHLVTQHLTNRYRGSESRPYPVSAEDYYNAPDEILVGLYAESGNEGAYMKDMQYL